MSESRSGLLERLGPLGFLITFVVIALVLAFVNNRPSDQAPAEVAQHAASSGQTPSTDGTDEPQADREPTPAMQSTDTDKPAAGDGATGSDPESDRTAETPETATETETEAAAVQPVDQAAPSNTPETGETETVSQTMTTGSEAPSVETKADDGDAPVAETGSEPGNADPDDASTQAGAGASEPTAAASTLEDPRFVVGETSRGLMETARRTLGDAPVVDAASGKIAEDARTDLVALVDALAQNESLVIGIAARLSDSLGILGFPAAEKRAVAVRQFLVDHGIDERRMVAGVLSPDYEPDDGIKRQVSFFFAERR